MANNATKFGTLVVGVLIAGGLILNARKDSVITRGDVILDTTVSQYPSIQVGYNTTLTNVLEFGSGSANVRFRGYKLGSGSEVNLFGDLALTEVNGRSSGALVITNPFNDPLLCTAPVLDVTTASNPITAVDVYAATGSLTSLAPGATGSTVLQENMRLGAVDVYTLSGSALFDAGSRPKQFKLHPITATTKVNRIIIASDLQTGALLDGTYTVRCTLDG